LGVGGLGPPNVKKFFFVFRGCCFGDSIVPIWTCCRKNFRFFWSAVLKLGRFKVTKHVLFGPMYGRVSTPAVSVTYLFGVTSPSAALGRAGGKHVRYAGPIASVINLSGNLL
jgi:hypothetical protein